MAEEQVASVLIRSARVGRPAKRTRVHQPDELVRFDARIPARVAQRLYDAAYEARRPVTAVLADVLAKAFDEDTGGGMT